MTILCVTANPNIERTWIVPHFSPGQINRVESIFINPSGKGNNVGRAIQILGGNPICTGILGGNSGRYLAEMMEKKDIRSFWTWIEAETRTSCILIDPETRKNDSTLLSEPGPHVQEADWDRFEKDILSAAKEINVACLCGSIPQGSSPNIYAHLVRKLKDLGISVWVDCDGAALSLAVQAKPEGIKINLREFEGLAGRDLRNRRDILTVGKEFLRGGIRRLVVTMGSKGAVMMGEEDVFWGKAAVTEAISSVGSGDAFFAGLLLGIDRDLPIDQSFRMGLACGAANTLQPGACSFKRADYDLFLDLIEIKRI